MKRVAYEPRYLAHLRDTLAIKGVRRVVMHEPLTNLRKVVFVQFAPGMPRTEVWRALHGAASLQADIGKYVIAVSEDIEPENPNAVFWSLAYRANPIDDVQIVPYRAAGHGPKSGPRGEESTMLIDATLKDIAPPLALPKREYMERARKIWDELGLPALIPQSPWHGYSLGDWDAAWDVYASRAVSGQWEETGKETFARRRGGLTPETPVKSVKD
jgi:4-hydroxy-3-polyprenylbenzoate decarboxylase